MNNLKFYFARLRQASWAELRHRALAAMRSWRWRMHFYKGKFGPEKIPKIDLNTIKALQLPDITWKGEEQTIRRLLNGEVFTLNADKKAIEHFEEKYRGVFFADIPLFNSRIDIRQVWEPARLQNITILLLACLNNQIWLRLRESQAVAQKALLHWIDENAFLSGPHYMSAMECGLRIPVFFLH